MHRIKPFLAKSEAWFIENDLHIYFGALTIVVVGVMGWMLHSEVERSNSLRDTNVELLSRIIEKDMTIYKLQSEVTNLKSYPLLPAATEVKPVVETVDKISSKLNAKIEKVQNTLISAPSEPKVVTRTEIQTVEKSAPVDSELKAMMQQSFCSSFPDDKACKKVKK